MQTFDFLVIGSGPAGQHAAIQAAKLGKHVALLERGAQVGGVTVHTGTIPSKTLREAILYLTGWRQRSIYGRDYRVKQSITAEDLARRLQFTIKHEVNVIEDQFWVVFFDPDAGIMSLNDKYLNAVADYLASPSELEDNFRLLASKRHYKQLFQKYVQRHASGICQ